MGKKLTTEEFIEKAKLIHGNKFDYSKVEYVNTSEKVCIICPKHGEFWQRPNDHLSGYGCKKCATENNKKCQIFTLSEVISMAKKVHGEKYDYSQSVYFGMNEKMYIICPIHGGFWQTPANHIHGGKGCKKCGHIKRWDAIGRTTKDDFISSANLIHDNKYDYSNVVYKNTKEKVSILCPLHGEFWQSPSKHVIGKQGCPECSKNKVWDTRVRRTTEEFIKLSKEVHGDKYDYSKTDYRGINEKVIIICHEIDTKTGEEHGEFLQSPSKHLSGQSCPLCSKKRLYSETILWKKLCSKYNNMNVIHGYYNSAILGKKSIDIYFPEIKVGVEYQGGQHFKPVSLYGGVTSYIKTLERDKLKFDECNNNGIRLLYYTTETWNLPSDYFGTIYTKFDDLCALIDEIIEGNNIDNR